MNYQNRVCCFVDILGFKHHIDQTLNESGGDNVDKIESISSILALSKDITGNNELLASKVVTYFSDSIVISYEYNEAGQLFKILLELMHLSMELANRGFLTRGGVAVGKLIHTDKVIFGPALVRAHHLESKESKYPRIIVDKKVIEQGLEFPYESHDTEEEKEHIKNILSQDDDGFNLEIDSSFPSALKSL